MLSVEFNKLCLRDWIFADFCVNNINWVNVCFFFRLKMHEERKTKTRDNEKVPEGAVPAYLLDREGQSRAKVLSNMIKQKRKEKAVSIWWIGD